MTTVNAPTVHNIAIEGTFDDCQAIVKALFNDQAFRDRLGLAGVNSINWARIMAQTVYYVTAALSLGAPGRAVSFYGAHRQFGDIFAGFVAKRMGLPIDRLVIATNENDILDRTLKSGRYEKRGVKASTSPSMDIQVSSNFERLIFDMPTTAMPAPSDAEPQAVRRLHHRRPGVDQIRHEFDSGPPTRPKPPPPSGDTRGDGRTARPAYGGGLRRGAQAQAPPARW